MSSVTSEQYLNELLERRLPKIENATVMIFRLRLKSAFETSFGSIDYREIVICRLDAEGLIGYGESASDEDPLYSYETTFTSRYALEKYLLPQLRSHKTIGAFLSAISPIRGYPMAKATVEGALWDLLAKKEMKPLHKLWGASKEKIPCGVSIGLQKDNETLLRTLRDYLSQGYRRIKVKIKPGRDVSLIEVIRNQFPELPLMADANAARHLRTFAVAA
jgi:O-succinylbenzoate synthase